MSSPLAQLPETSWLKRGPEVRIRPVFALSENFGVIDVDTRPDDATLSFTVVSSRGSTAWRPLMLHASDLVPGVQSWERMQSPAAARATSSAR